ncbi:ABC transporter substrate-binding protein [Herbivorax sp. ANBcel31]|uniref:ABC transporter substrate-binding protein n=1 Tax=Herbivorax sp. ANBcel31 TaxID=3069754 RepID=UPI0027B2DDD4|nr:ABC transporter substrate-binding protein [Herbivorax sp. ANBcel31]MDQ2084939.1 ABC transporter substrate-binding protein [Herbivorax sp. ANBcel31]
MRTYRIILNLIILNFICLFMLSCSIMSSQETNTHEKGKNSECSELPPYHIVWYHINTPQKDTELVLEEVNKYLKEKINATLEIRMIGWQDYDREIDAVIASGEPYDICFTAAYKNCYTQNAANETFIELDFLLKEHGKGILKNLDPIFFEGARVNGKIYAVPANKEIAHQNALMFNKKYVEKYGFDPSDISSLYDIEPMLKIIKEKEPDIIPYAVQSAYTNAPSLPFDTIMENIPGALYYDNRTEYEIINQFNTPEYKDFFTTMRRWYLAGYIPKEAAFALQLEDYEKSGKWFVSPLSNVPHSDITLKMRFGYEVVVVPLQNPIIENRDCQGSMLAVSKTSQDPERVMMFLNLLYTDKYLYNLIVFGIEGKHYIKKSENIIEFPEGINQHNSSYTIAPFTLGNMYLSYFDKRYPPTIWEDYKKFNQSAVESPLLGFNFDPTPVKKEISAIQNASYEYWGPLVTGAVDPEVYLPEAISKYTALGLDRVIEEQQRQLDEWLELKKEK